MKMTYEEAIQYLYRQLPMFQRIGKAAYKADLHNTIALCEHLGNPHRAFKSIHVAGTNGKGSSSHMLAAILQAAGWNVGLYTSPHLKNFTERIRLNGKEVDTAFVAEFVEKNRWLIEQLSPSFFEITVAMAFEYFAQKHVDVAVVEVGLGGRLDSTNIITPVVSLITNISFDHQDLLGDTLTKIALEKAGVIKEQTPVVISQTQEEVKAVFCQKAQEKKAAIYFADEFYRVERDGESGRMNVWRENQLFLENLQLDLKGHYQRYNVMGVLKTLDVWQERENICLSSASLRQGLENAARLTGLKGRWQQLGEHPRIICDIGHNEDGIQQILACLAEEYQKKPFSTLHWVLGTVSDKDVEKILALLPKTAFYYFCQANIPRALAAEELAQKAKSQGLNGIVVRDVNQALAEAVKRSEPNDLILVAGSTFVVAEIHDL